MGDHHDPETDVAHLRDVQYRTSAQLAKRANLHVRYRTAPSSAFATFAALLPWRAGARVLDVGCGSGLLWEEIAPLVPEGVRLVLVDLSPGMVDEAVTRASATGRYAEVTGQVTDARSLPFADASFDLAVSTYALYHVPTPERAVAELARVVTDEGTVGVVTNGPGHLRELEEVRVAVYGESARYEVNRTFAPAVAAPVLIDAFGEVAWHRYDDTLRVTDSVPPAVALSAHSGGGRSTSASGRASNSARSGVSYRRCTVTA